MELRHLPLPRHGVAFLSRNGGHHPPDSHSRSDMAAKHAFCRVDGCSRRGMPVVPGVGSDGRPNRRRREGVAPGCCRAIAGVPGVPVARAVTWLRLDTGALRCRETVNPGTVPHPPIRRGVGPDVGLDSGTDVGHGASTPAYISRARQRPRRPVQVIQEQCPDPAL